MQSILQARLYTTNMLNVWRNIFHQVVHFFYMFSYSFEDDQILNSEDNTQKMALEEIQNIYSNMLGTTTESEWLPTIFDTPTQMLIKGMLANIKHDAVAFNNVFGDDPYNQENLEAGLAKHGIQLSQLQANSEDLE